MGYDNDASFAGKMTPLVIQIVGPHLLVPASLDLDRREATDLIVLTARDMRIAARVRRYGYYNFRHEFTLRAKRDSGVTTELTKIINGWGDWLFYGHASQDAMIIEHWMIICLKAFRAALIRHESSLHMGMRPNCDGETYFSWYDVRSFLPYEPKILVATNIDFRS